MLVNVCLKYPKECLETPSVLCFYKVWYPLYKLLACPRHCQTFSLLASMFFRDNRTSGLQRKGRQVPSYLLRMLNPNLPHLLLHFTMYKLTATAIFKSRVHFVHEFTVLYTSLGLSQSRFTYVRNKNTVKKKKNQPQNIKSV